MDFLKDLANKVKDSVTNAQTTFEKENNCEEVTCVDLLNLLHTTELKAKIDRKTLTIQFSCVLSKELLKFKGQYFFIDKENKIFNLNNGTEEVKAEPIKMNSKDEILDTTKANFTYRIIELR